MISHICALRSKILTCCFFKSKLSGLGKSYDFDEPLIRRDKGPIMKKRGPHLPLVYPTLQLMEISKRDEFKDHTSWYENLFSWWILEKSEIHIIDPHHSLILLRAGVNERGEDGLWVGLGLFVLVFCFVFNKENEEKDIIRNPLQAFQ